MQLTKVQYTAKHAPPAVSDYSRTDYIQENF